MKSSNPHSGIYEADTARTLYNNGGSPACNQGGMAVVAIEGNGSRPSHQGDGYAETETMYTLNRVEQHAVYDARGNGEGGGVSPTITGDHQNRITDYTAIVLNDQGGSHMSVSEGITSTLRSQMNGHPPLLFKPGQGADARSLAISDQVSPTLNTQNGGGGNHDTVGALCAADHKGAGAQYVDRGKLIW